MAAADSRGIAGQLADDLVEVQAAHLREHRRATRSRATRIGLQVALVVGTAGALFGAVVPLGQAWTEAVTSFMAGLPRASLPDSIASPIILLGLMSVTVGVLAYALVAWRAVPGLAVEAVGIVNLPVLEARTSQQETFYIDLSGMTRATELRYFPASEIDALEAQLANIPGKKAARAMLLDTTEREEVGVDGVQGDKIRIYGSEASFRKVAASITGSLSRTAWLSDSLPLLEPDEPLAQLAREAFGRKERLEPAFSASLAPSMLNVDDVLTVLGRAFPAKSGSEASGESGVGRIEAMRQQVSQVSEEFARRRERTLHHAVPFQEGKVFEAADLPSYVFYCPDCNAERIARLAERRGPEDPLPPNSLTFNPSSRMSFDVSAGDWVCPLCEGHSHVPFPVHRLLDQLLHPLFDNLILQNQVERTKLYARAKEDKRRHQVEFDREVAEMKRQHGRLDQDGKRRVRELKATIDGELATVEGLTLALQRAQQHFKDRLSQVQREFGTIRQQTVDQAAQAVSALDTHYARQNAQFDRAMQRFVAQARRDDIARMQELQSIARNTRAAAQAAERTAASSERTAAATGQAAKMATKSTAIQSAMARKAGLFKPKAWNVAGRVGYSVESAKRAMSPLSEVGYEERKLGA